jgi:hypothetical protein
MKKSPAEIKQELSEVEDVICCKIKMEKVAKQKWRKLQLEIP